MQNVISSNLVPPTTQSALNSAGQKFYIASVCRLASNQEKANGYMRVQILLGRPLQDRVTQRQSTTMTWWESTFQNCPRLPNNLPCSYNGHYVRLSSGTKGFESPTGRHVISCSTSGLSHHPFTVTCRGSNPLQDAMRS